jgi:hypothetical protein
VSVSPIYMAERMNGESWSRVCEMAVLRVRHEVWAIKAGVPRLS